MKKYLVGIMFLLLSVYGIEMKADSAPPSAIFGANGECDTTLAGCQVIPLSLSTLCTVSCAVRVSPSLTSATRMWGASGYGGSGLCMTSIDGGASWAACTSQPFTTGSVELYAGAADGSVIAVGSPTGPTTCTIRRSTDNGTNWSDVFTQLGNCSPASIEGQYLFCLSSGICELSSFTGGVGLTVIRSSNNGQSWIADAAIADGSGCIHAGASWNDSVGITVPEATGCGGGGVADTAAADVWTASTIWNGTQGDCWGTTVLNGVGRGICFAATNYTLRNSTGALVSNLTIPNVLAALDSGGVAVSPFADTTYFFASTATTIGVWVSRDSMSTFTQLGDIVGSMRGGNAFFANGCVYFSGGTAARFAKIC